ISKKGYMNSIICLKYLENIFHPETSEIANGSWRLLIYDGFDSHLDPAVVNFCWNHRIIPYCLPAHTSHISQPLDVSVFSSLQNYYSEEVNKLQGRAITNDNFPNLLARARRKAFTEKNIKAGFRASGIVPLNPNVILNKLQRLDTPPPIAEFTTP
ncbi:DDE-domain-containing protein, partial [Morchella conica CCBAS932]